VLRLSFGSPRRTAKYLQQWLILYAATVCD